MRTEPDCMCLGLQTTPCATAASASARVRGTPTRMAVWRTEPLVRAASTAAQPRFAGSLSRRRPHTAALQPQGKRMQRFEGRINAAPVSKVRACAAPSPTNRRVRWKSSRRSLACAMHSCSATCSTSATRFHYLERLQTQCARARDASRLAARGTWRRRTEPLWSRRSTHERGWCAKPREGVRHE